MASTVSSENRITEFSVKIAIAVVLFLFFSVTTISPVEGVKDLDCYKADDFQCEDGACVKRAKLCDLFDDYRDGSDENNCLNNVCSYNEFRCSSGQCIKKEEFCDGYPECFDKSDENNCTECFNPTDSDSRHPLFKCKTNNKCISLFSLCNLHLECPDGSDEDESTCNSPSRRCGEELFTCQSGECARHDARCNGSPDCSDNSDEENCTQCEPSTFKCKTNAMCILDWKVCDTEPDCPDGSDESQLVCKGKKCEAESYFRCNSGECIRNYKNSDVCDGLGQCKDGSDEANCTICKSKAFKCPNGGGCLQRSDLCNGKHDCPDGSDESQIFCPSGTTPQTWTTFWRQYQTSNIKNLSKVFSNAHVAVYIEAADNSLSPLWPISYLSQAWKYSKETYGPLGSNPLLYVILAKNKEDIHHQYQFVYTQQEAGHRNLIDTGLRQRHGWTIEKAENFELLFRNLAIVVQGAAKGNLNYEDLEICEESVMNIVLYDIYKHLKGLSADVLTWRKGKEEDNIRVDKINCFQDWLLPIYKMYGGSGVLSKYFAIIRKQWRKKKGIYAKSIDGHKQLNLGEFVHFWSGAAGVDLTHLANATFRWSESNEIQSQRAKMHFQGLEHSDLNSNRGNLSLGFIAGVIAGIILVLILIVLAGVKLVVPYVRQKYFQVDQDNL